MYEHRNRSTASSSQGEILALKTARAALDGRINKSYKFIVLKDPDGSGHLVYALATSKDPNDVMFVGHFRVTVSADGEKAEAVEVLSRGLNIGKKTHPNHPGAVESALWTIQHRCRNTQAVKCDDEL